MTDEPEKSHLKDLRLAPIGMPELLCRVCGGPKPPKQRCWECYKEGRVYRGREVTDPARRIKLKRERSKLIADSKAAYKRRNSITKKGKTHGRYSRQHRRVFQCQELDRLLSILLRLFERDSLGHWQLYADRLPELQQHLDLAEWSLPRLRKLLPYDQTKAPADTIAQLANLLKKSLGG